MKGHPTSLVVMCDQLVESTFEFDFLDQVYCYKSVATQNIYGAKTKKNHRNLLYPTINELTMDTKTK